MSFYDCNAMQLSPDMTLSMVATSKNQNKTKKTTKLSKQQKRIHKSQHFIYYNVINFGGGVESFV